MLLLRGRHSLVLLPRAVAASCARAIRWPSGSAGRRAYAAHVQRSRVRHNRAHAGAAAAALERLYILGRQLSGPHRVAQRVAAHGSRSTGLHSGGATGGQIRGTGVRRPAAMGKAAPQRGVPNPSRGRGRATPHGRGVGRSVGGVGLPAWAVRGSGGGGRSSKGYRRL